MTDTAVRPKNESRNESRGSARRRDRPHRGAAAESDGRRYGAALLGGAALLLLVGGLAQGAWRHHQADLGVAATAQAEQGACARRSRRRGTRQRRHDDRHVAGDDDRVRGGEYFRAHQRLYRKALRRYRRSGQGGRPAGQTSSPLNSTIRLRKPRRRWLRTGRRCSKQQASRDLAQVTNARDSNLVKQGWLTLQQGDNDRLTLQAQTGGGRSGSVEYCGPGSPNSHTRAGEGLPARRGAVRRRHHPAQHRQRQPGDVRVDLHVHVDAFQRYPHPGVRAAGRGVRAWARRRRGGSCSREFRIVRFRAR